AAHVLRRVERLPLARADPQHALGVEQKPVTVMTSARHLRRLPPDHLDTFEFAATLNIAFQRRARDRRAALVTRVALGIAEIDQPVLRELRMQRDIAEPALAAVV